MKYDELKFFTDGGSRGNPGPSGSGVVLLDMDDNVIEAFGEYIGIASNNVAEWTAVKLALAAAAKYEPKIIHGYMDSELVCKQLNGIYRIKHIDLRPIFLEVQKLARGYQVDYNHVYREYNQLADAQVNLAIDRALGLKS